MDYEALFQIVPKIPLQWSTSEVTSWLQYINLERLVPAFEYASVDGSCIHLLDEQTLIQQLGVNSKIVRKKLMNWINKGFADYQTFLLEMNKMINENQELPNLSKNMTSHMREKVYSKSIFVQNPLENKQIKPQKDQYMIIESFQGSNLGAYILNCNQMITLGKDNSNMIQNIQCSVENQHATIFNRQHRYFIKDLGSQSGTYIQITQRVEMQQGMVVQIGSFQFRVLSTNNLLENLKLQCLTGNLNEQKSSEENSRVSIFRRSLEKKSNILEIDFSQSNKYTFGRRKDNNFQRDDKHMSGIHCKMTFFNNKFYVQDMASTNGTWIRISQSFCPSQEIEVYDGTVIKIGTIATYICKIVGQKIAKKQKNEFSMQQQQICINCKKQQNNCLFVPCSHNIVCLNCSSYYSECPQCRQPITNKIRIIK